MWVNGICPCPVIASSNVQVAKIPSNFKHLLALVTNILQDFLSAADLFIVVRIMGASFMKVLLQLLASSSCSGKLPPLNNSALADGQALNRISRFNVRKVVAGNQILALGAAIRLSTHQTSHFSSICAPVTHWESTCRLHTPPTT